jgi:hypothetical protein
MNTVLNEWTGLSRDGEASFSPLMRLSIPPERINWMLANPGFTAFKDQVV